MLPLFMASAAIASIFSSIVSRLTGPFRLALFTASTMPFGMPISPHSSRIAPGSSPGSN